jgi:hypothetical protein
MHSTPTKDFFSNNEVHIKKENLLTFTTLGHCSRSKAVIKGRWKIVASE